MLSGNIPENPPEPQQLGGGSAMETAILAQLINSPQFVQIKQLLRTNPAALQPVLAQIQQSSPQIYALIASNPEAFERLIMEDNPEGEGGLGDLPNIGQQQQNQPPPGSIMVTQEEKLAIERLAALGFPKVEAAQAYLACDKNE